MGSKKKTRTGPPQAPLPWTVLLRVVLVAGLAVAACIVALVRYYTHPRAPMVMPVPTDTSPNAPSLPDGEIPAPTVVPVP
jgi:hypothetical protein